jgi:2-keto-4-pentenoate hydratase
MSELASLLLAARRNPADRIAALPDALKPKTMAEALAVQHEVAKSFAIGGWKVGAPGGTPACGGLPAATIQPSGAVLAPQSHPLRIVESEVAFRLGADLPPRPTPYSQDEVRAALATMHPVIEVCESRYVEPNDFDLFAQLADTQSHGGLVWGPGRADWHGIDLAAEHCRQIVNGELNAERTGYPFGDIFRLVTWLANEGSAWAGGLKAGQFVTCGSWSGANRVPPGAEVKAVFASLGEAVITYAA